MKRSVAILGNTPQFVRWAIEHSCGLRDSTVANLADHSFRQLRGLREYSTGIREGRIFEHFCVHPCSNSDQPSQARGFHRSEVLDAHGGLIAVQSECDACPANALSQSQPGLWGGCYGWLPATNEFNIDSMLRNGVRSDNGSIVPNQSGKPLDIISVFESVIGNLMPNRETPLFPVTTPHWYGLWSNPTPTREQLQYIKKLLTESLVCLRADESESPTDATCISQLLDAVNRCIDHQLKLHVELVPPGFSDGNTWTLTAHCPNCKTEVLTDTPQECTVCGRFGAPHGRQKSKVLGLRPYVQLEGVLGKRKTLEFLKRFESRPLKQ